MELTVKEALEQGYLHCTNDPERIGGLDDINDISKEMFEDNEWWLAEKDPIFPKIKDYDFHHLFDVILERWCDDTGDENYDDMMESLKALDLSSAKTKIADELKKRKWYRWTTIKLIPNR